MNFLASRKSAIADVSREVGQVVFAAILVQPLVSGTSKPLMIIMGVVLSLICFGITIFLNKSDK